MQNNQSYLQQDFLFDFDLAEDDRNTEEVDFLKDLNDKDEFGGSYAEFNSETQSLDNSDLNASQPCINQSVDGDLYDRGDSFLNTTINYADYDYEDNFSQVEENEIHYLNFIKKSQLAVSQKNAEKSYRYSDYHQQKEDFKTYTIVCIDDSRAVINAIKMYLDDNFFSVVGINDPLKALMQIVRLKPDVILLDITMPTLDGYELCSLLRKHSSLKETPVIMVTGRKGIINRVKAKMVKASDYLTKPFHKKDLLKVMFKYIV
jgi:twitching motility two-component system response regulator PilG